MPMARSQGGAGEAVCCRRFGRDSAFANHDPEATRGPPARALPFAQLRVSIGVGGGGGVWRGELGWVGVDARHPSAMPRGQGSIRRGGGRGEGGLKGGSEGGGGGWLGHSSSLRPPVVPAKGGPENFEA